MQFLLLDLSETKLIDADLAVMTVPCKYDVILGRDLLTDLGISINFKEQEIEWDGRTTPMRSTSDAREDVWEVQDAHFSS